MAVLLRQSTVNKTLSSATLFEIFFFDLLTLSALKLHFHNILLALCDLCGEYLLIINHRATEDTESLLTMIAALLLFTSLYIMCITSKKNAVAFGLLLNNCVKHPMRLLSYCLIFIWLLPMIPYRHEMSTSLKCRLLLPKSNRLC
jgi:hypothetical protein